MPIKTHSILSLKQKDNHTFSINWSDGKISDYRLSDLQKNCPCANCVDESTGERRHPTKLISDDVKATNIQNIGRYALKIFFTSGCSTGIYDFDLLKNLANSKGQKI